MIHQREGEGERERRRLKKRTAHIKSRDPQIRLAAKKGLRQVLKAVAHRGHGVRVDVVEARHRGVAADGGAPSRTAVKFAAREDRGRRKIEGARPGLVLGGRRDEHVLAGGGEGVVEDANVLLGPAVVVGEDDGGGVDGGREEEEEEKEGWEEIVWERFCSHLVLLGAQGLAFLDAFVGVNELTLIHYTVVKLEVIRWMNAFLSKKS